MASIQNYGNWMSEQIAKVYLLECNLFDIHQPLNGKFDFLITPKNNIRIQIGIEVKASQYEKNKILQTYRVIRQKYLQSSIPVIMLYINYINKTGFIEVIDKKIQDALFPLTTENLRNAIDGITSKNTKKRRLQ